MRLSDMKFPAFEPIDLSNNPQSFEAIDLYLSQIEADSNQPRKIFSEDTLEELATSIKNHGVIQPIIVRDIDSGKKYQIIAGERRWRAAKMAGLEKIPAIIKEYDSVQRMAVSLIENIQRENLNPLEEAQAIQSLLNECDMTHNEVAESIGRSRTTVTNILRLLTLTREVKVMVNSGFLEMGHARALLCLPNAQQIEAAELVILKNLSVRETEKLVQRMSMGQNKKVININQEYQTKAAKWNTLLSRKFSSNVNVNLKSDGKGKVVFQFETIEEAEWLIDNLMDTDLRKEG
jgi:ParB family chromosome partitioning protein